MHTQTSTQSRTRLRRVAAPARRIGAAALIVLGTATFFGHVADAATTNATATITNPATSQELDSGGSATVFTIALPDGAVCSGDTANDGYHVYSYLLPKGTAVTAATFVNFPSQGFGFVDETATYYGARNTAINTGQIIGIPNNFVWGKLVTTGGGAVELSALLNGGSSVEWNAGLVCADTNGNPVDWWNTAVTFTADGTDPAGFTWTAVPGASTSTTTSTSSSTSTSTSSTTSTTSSTTPTTSTTTPVGPTGTGSPTDISGTGSGSGSTSGTGGGSGDLPRTGSQAFRITAMGSLAIGIGLILLGLDLKWRARRVLFRT